MYTKNQKGVSLIELLMVISIISIMVLIAVPGYTRDRKMKALSLAKTQIKNDIRVAQNYTMTLLQCSDGKFPAGGYGLYFETGVNNYVIFADKNSSQVYDSGEMYSAVNLPEGIKITNIEVVNGDSGVSGLHFVNTPPYGKMYINKSGIEGVNKPVATLTLDNGIANMTVEIDVTGIIK